MTKREKDGISGTEMTGHEWDGIKELDTPTPRWWLWSYLATVIFALGYVIAYPAWPLIHGATPGVLGYSSRAELAHDLADARTDQKGQLDQMVSLSLEDIRRDPKTLEFALAGGKAAFRINCIQCHGSGAAGGNGYPNLNDDDWLWGGTLDQIRTTLQHGIRYTADADTRQSLMPSFGADGILKPEEIGDVAEFVLKISGKTNDPAASARGAPLFKDNCATCHGESGEGNRDFGAPKLTDAISLYGVSDKASIVAQIIKPKQGVMPAWTTRLDDITIKQLTVYVHELGGGEMPTP
jgi:cytochrome c oxidase cbb3-type subunit III